MRGSADRWIQHTFLQPYRLLHQLSGFPTLLTVWKVLCCSVFTICHSMVWLYSFPFYWTHRGRYLYACKNCCHVNPLESKGTIVSHRIAWRWYTGHWWVGCYIWYSKEGMGRAPARPLSSLLYQNVTAHPSTSSVYQSPYCCTMVRCSAVLMYLLKD